MGVPLPHRRARLERAGAPAAPPPDHEQMLRQLLTLAANTVTPSPDALARIRGRIAAGRVSRWRRWLSRPLTFRQLTERIDTDDVRSGRGARPADQPAATDRTSEAAAESPREETAMTPIIQRRAKQVRAGEIIVRHPNPERNGESVRWRVSDRPKVTSDGVVIIDYIDISDEPRAGIAWCDAMRMLHVEPRHGQDAA